MNEDVRTEYSHRNSFWNCAQMNWVCACGDGTRHIEHFWLWRTFDDEFSFLSCSRRTLEKKAILSTLLIFLSRFLLFHHRVCVCCVYVNLSAENGFVVALDNSEPICWDWKVQFNRMGVTHTQWVKRRWRQHPPLAAFTLHTHLYIMIVASMIVRYNCKSSMGRSKLLTHTWDISISESKQKREKQRLYNRTLILLSKSLMLILSSHIISWAFSFSLSLSRRLN